MKIQQATPFGYRAGTTVLHRVPAGIKLLCVIIISTAACFSVYGLAAAILVILAASIAARISPRQLLSGSKLLVIVSLCIILLKTFEQGGAPSLEGEVTTPEIIIGNFYIPDIYIPAINAHGCVDGIITALRILIPFAAAAALFTVTTMRELHLSLAALEMRLKKSSAQRRKDAEKGGMSANCPQLSVSRTEGSRCLSEKDLEDKLIRMERGNSAFVSLSICLMLGFIPRFFERWEAANLACDARSCKRGLRRLFLLVPLVTERMMESAADTALALQARGFASGS